MLNASLPAEAEPVVTLSDRKVYHLTAASVLGQVGNWRDRAWAFSLAEGWHAIEDWGAWASKRNPKVSFGTTCKPGERIRVLLRLRLPPATETGAVVYANETSVKNVRLTGAPQWVAFEATVKENGCCDILLKRVGQVVQHEQSRELFIGIDAIAYHKSDDLIGRLEVLEAILSPGQPLIM